MQVSNCDLRERERDFIFIYLERFMLKFGIFSPARERSSSLNVFEKRREKINFLDWQFFSNTGKIFRMLQREHKNNCNLCYQRAKLCLQLASAKQHHRAASASDSRGKLGTCLIPRRDTRREKAAIMLFLSHTAETMARWLIIIIRKSTGS